MRCKNAEPNDKGKFNCKLNNEECVYLLPDEQECINDKQYENNDWDLW